MDYQKKNNRRKKPNLAGNALILAVVGLTTVTLGVVMSDYPSVLRIEMTSGGGKFEFQRTN